MQNEERRGREGGSEAVLYTTHDGLVDSASSGTSGGPRTSPSATPGAGLVPTSLILVTLRSHTDKEVPSSATRDATLSRGFMPCGFFSSQPIQPDLALFGSV